MKSHEHKTGFTLVEMIIVVAIIALLATMVIGIAARVDSQGKERLMKETFELLDAALEEFRDYGYDYEIPTTYLDKQREFYLSLDFPIDCNNFDKNRLEEILGDLLDTTNSPLIDRGVYEPNYSGSTALYFFLSRVPSCRKTLDKIHRPDKGGIVKSLITNKDALGHDLQITVDGRVYPLMRIVDPWGKTLRYDYYENEREGTLTWRRRRETKRSFPLITSAGPDGIFGNTDDIKSIDRK